MVKKRTCARSTSASNADEKGTIPPNVDSLVRTNATSADISATISISAIRTKIIPIIKIMLVTHTRKSVSVRLIMPRTRTKRMMLPHPTQLRTSHLYFR